MDVLLVLVVGAFVALCGAAVRRGIRFRHPASIWLAASFAALALTATVAIHLERVHTPGVAFLVLVGTALGLVAHPITLLQFSHALRPVSRTARLALVALAGGLLATVVAIGAVDPFAFDDDTGGGIPPMAMGVLLAVSCTWLGVTGTVGGRLVQFGRELTSSVGRARAWTMAGSILILGPAIALPFLLPGLTEITGTLLALVASVFTYLGYVPPRWLRWTWARRDTQRLAAAELAVLHAPSVDLTSWLHTVMEVWDGHAARFEVDGRTVATAGDDPDHATRTATRAVGDDARVERADEDTWRLVADVDGARLTVVTTLDPLLFGDDASDLMLSTAARMRSTEARRALEAASRRQQDELHRAETAQLRDDVLSTLSHELRTPLVTLRGIPELLLQRGDEMTFTQVRPLLARLHANALGLHRLVESTLLLAQVRSHEVLPKFIDTSPRAVVDEALERLEIVGVDLARVDVGVLPDEPVRADPVLSGAALSELLHNALIFSDAPAPVRVVGRRDDGHLHLDVVDRGRGIDAADTDRVRQPFHRAGEVLTRDRRGLGLGLTLASDLALLLDADLLARSPAVGGTVVTLSLPVDPAPAA